MPLLFLLVPLGLLLFFLSVPPSVGTLLNLPWVPELGVSFSLSLNPASLFMAVLITTIGTVITFFAVQYMKTDRDRYRFWTFFIAFMLSMLGLVLSENLITLFLFWEFTSICSYFLIGHYFDDADARRSALNSLMVTGGGGIFLLVGFIGLGAIAGTYEISEILAQKEALLAHPQIAWALAAVLIGVMTKSAQFPFHFWLPQAMAGPAPVSAFLHSATMVKAGVFLLIRLFPIFGELPLWEPVLTIIGLTTFVWGGVVAVRHFDMKSILANTTISALGCLVALLGMASSYPRALEGMLLFFLAHAFYKAALFMCTGIIEIRLGGKDLRSLKLKFKDEPVLAFALTLACLSMMGLPPTLGFIAKEVYLEFSAVSLLYLIPLMLGSLLNFTAAGKILYHLFLEKKAASAVQEPATLLYSLAPGVLGLGTLLLSFAGPWGLNEFVAGFLRQMGAAADVHIALWHGFNLPLLLSVVTAALGVVLLATLKGMSKGLEDKALSRFSPTELYHQFMSGLQKVGSFTTLHYQSGYLRRYFLVIFSASAFLILLSIWLLKPEVDFVASPVNFLDVCLGLIIIFSTVSTIVTESKIWAVTQMGVVGTCLILLFIFYGAPDLALTQLLIEIFTLTIFVFALHRLPRLKYFSTVKTRLRDLCIALVFGGAMGYLTYFSFSHNLDKTVAGYYAQSAFTEAQGRNIVNVILVDFRSLDTLGEISVVLMAAIGVYLLMRKRGEPT